MYQSPLSGSPPRRQFVQDAIAPYPFLSSNNISSPFSLNTFSAMTFLSIAIIKFYLFFGIIDLDFLCNNPFTNTANMNEQVRNINSHDFHLKKDLSTCLFGYRYIGKVTIHSLSRTQCVPEKIRTNRIMQHAYCQTEVKEYNLRIIKYI